MLESLRDDVCLKLEKGDPDGAFDLLLARWREDRSTEIAELCEKLSERVARDAPPVGGKSQADQLIAWTKAFRETSPLGLGRLLLGLDANVTHPRFVFPRADAVSTVQDDPRISAIMLRMLTSIRGGSAWQKVVLRCFRAVEASSDPRSIDALELLLSEKGKRIAVDRSVKDFALERGAKVLASLRARSPAGPPTIALQDAAAVQDMHRAIDALGKVDVPLRMKPSKGDPAELLARIWAQPEDLELRLVLADALTEAGDPRGELVLLQTARAEQRADRKALARERQLLKTHARAFLGPLAAVVSLKSAVFERGFLERCEANTNQTAARIHFEHPEWATVKSIRFIGVGSRVTSAMRSLREALGVDLQGLKQLFETGHPTLERLELSRRTWFSRHTTGATFGASPALPALRHLKLNVDGDADDVAWLWNARWASQLTTLGVDIWRRSNEPLLSGWARVFDERKHLEELTVFLGEYDICASLTRSGEKAALTVRVTKHASRFSALENVARLLRQFEQSPNIDTVEIDLDPELPVDLDAQARAAIVAAAQRIGTLRDVTFTTSRSSPPSPSPHHMGSNELSQGGPS